MSKRQFLIILGILVMAFLFLHLPSSWDKAFALIAGLLIVIIAFKLAPKQKTVSSAEIPYVEHRNDFKPRVETEAVETRSQVEQRNDPESHAETNMPQVLEQRTERAERSVELNNTNNMIFPNTSPIENSNTIIKTDSAMTP